MNKPYISIIIPAHNEVDRIQKTLMRLTDYLWTTNYSYEIIVVANGCTDGTTLAASWAAVPVVRIIEIHQAGKGRAVREGMLSATGRFRYMCDADLSCEPDMLPRFLKAAHSGYHLAIGDRRHPGSVISTTWQRRFIGQMFSTLTDSIVPGIGDTQCGFKLFTQASAEYLFSRSTIDGFAFDVEILYLAQRAGMIIGKIPVVWKHDPGSSVHVLRDSLRMMRDLNRIRQAHHDSSLVQVKNKLPA